MVRTGFGTVLVVMLVATHAHGQIEAPESFIVVADLTGDGVVPASGGASTGTCAMTVSWLNVLDMDCRFEPAIPLSSVQLGIGAPGVAESAFENITLDDSTQQLLRHRKTDVTGSQADHLLNGRVFVQANSDAGGEMRGNFSASPTQTRYRFPLGEPLDDTTCVMLHDEGRNPNETISFIGGHCLVPAVQTARLRLGADPGGATLLDIDVPLGDDSLISWGATVNSLDVTDVYLEVLVADPAFGDVTVNGQVGGCAEKAATLCLGDPPASSSA